MKKSTYKPEDIKLFPSYTGVYSIFFLPSKKIYVGSAATTSGKVNSSNGFYCRWRKHLYMLRKKTHYSKPLQNAFNLYGEKNLRFSVLKKCAAKKCLIHEQKFIDQHNSFNKGYNGRPKASNNGGIQWSKKRRKKYFEKYAVIRKSKMQEIKNLYDQNKSTRDISKILGISRTYMKRIFNDNNIRAKSIGQTRRKSIIQYDLNGNKIKEWESILKCSDELNINRNSIRMVLNKTCKQSHGFFFKYKM